CGSAPGYTAMLLGRVARVARGGLIIPRTQTALSAAYPRHERGTATGTAALALSFAPEIGPGPSGWRVAHLPWQTLPSMRWPVAGLSVAVAYVVLRNVTGRSDPRLGVLSVILSSFGFGGLLFGFGRAGESGWASAPVLGPLI